MNTFPRLDGQDAALTAATKIVGAAEAVFSSNATGSGSPWLRETNAVDFPPFLPCPHSISTFFPSPRASLRLPAKP